MNSITMSKESQAPNKETSAMLNNVVSDLRSRSDVLGAVLLNNDGMIIAHALPHGSLSGTDLYELLPRLVELSNDTKNASKNIMCPHLLSDSKGHRILARSFEKDLLLLLFLHESCYMSTTMLDMENSILRIREILSSLVP